MSEVRVGEITGWRVWRIPHGTEDLRSMYMKDYVWINGEAQGRVTSYKKDQRGVHAFKRKWDAYEYAYLVGSMFASNTDSLAVGKVDLWGTIVEHEKGYRAENARAVRGSLHTFEIGPGTRIMSTVWIIAVVGVIFVSIGAAIWFFVKILVLLASLL